MLKDEVLIALAWVTLRLYIRKRGYFGQLQWDIMRKYPTKYTNLYVYGVLGIGDTIFTRVGKFSTETVCLTRGAWFGKFMRRSKLCMGVIKKQYFGVTSDMVKDMLVGWEIEWKSEVKNQKR